MGDGRLVAGVVVPGRDEAHDDAGDGQQVEGGVQQLAPHAPAAAARPVHQHRYTRGQLSNRCHLQLMNQIVTLAHAVDEASDHEDWVEVPLLVQVTGTGASEGEGEAASPRPSVLQHTGDV